MTKDETMTNDEVRTANADFDAFWEMDDESSILREEPASPHAYDLEERTAKFGEAVIDFTELVPLGPRTNRLVDQLTGCGTSVGANYCEADDAISKKEFLLRINTCRKEARETKFFLRMIVRAVPSLKPQARIVWREAKELHLIFSKICRTGK
jgi:four helix bundle protein